MVNTSLLSIKLSTIRTKWTNYNCKQKSNGNLLIEYCTLTCMSKVELKCVCQK